VYLYNVSEVEQWHNAASSYMLLSDGRWSLVIDLAGLPARSDMCAGVAELQAIRNILAHSKDKRGFIITRQLAGPRVRPPVTVA
jgi:hypothetical protein